MSRRKYYFLFLSLSLSICLGYFFFIATNLRGVLGRLNFIFGYIDYHNNWQAVESFISLATPFKDYVYEYGWFFLMLQAPAYLFFGQTFMALLISRYVAVPVFSILVSWLIGRLFFKSPWQIWLFLFLLFLFRTNCYDVSPRHLVAELSLAFLVAAFSRQDKKALAAGIIGGLGVLTALEYGVALNVSLLMAWILLKFLKSKPPVSLKLFKQFAIGEMLVLGPFVLWLVIKGAMGFFVDFNLGVMGNMYSVSPCSSDSFPRFSEIELFNGKSASIIGLPLTFLQRLNFYVVPVFYLFELLIFLFQLVRSGKVNEKNLVNFLLVCYGGMIYLRTLDDPCYGYFVYGLVPFFLLMVYRVSNVLSAKNKVPGVLLLTITIIWFTLTQNSEFISNYFSHSPSPTPQNELNIEHQWYPPVGWFLRKDLVKNYNEIASHIRLNTNEFDYVYSYPWGPYNQLSGRKSPTTLNNAVQFSLAGERFIEFTNKELELKKPKYVVINLYNNLGIVSFGKTRSESKYIGHFDEDGPLFLGWGNAVERFILENYQTEFHNKVGLVMSLRELKKPLLDTLEEVYVWKQDESRVFQLAKATDQIVVMTKVPSGVSEIEIEYKIDGNIVTKHLGRFFFDYYVLPAGKSDWMWVDTGLAKRGWQTRQIALGKPKVISGLRIEFGENRGFLWWLRPRSIEIKQIRFLLDRKYLFTVSDQQ